MNTVPNEDPAPTGAHPAGPAGRTPRHRMRVLAAVGVVVVLVGSAVAVATAVGARATSTATPPVHRAPLARPSGIPAADRPPPDPHATAPAVVVPSGQDQSDPVLYRIGGRYFLLTSGLPGTGGLPGADAVNVPEASAFDTGAWGPVTDALPELPPWAEPGFTWAPDLHQFGSAFVLYYTAMLRGSVPPTECIGDATGSSPAGPFRAVDRPFICQVALGGSIDPRVFTDADGSTWMLWKSDQNIGGATTPTRMWSARLSADGRSLVGPAHQLMGPDEAWQSTVVEAPDMVEVDGAYWLFYSGNWFNQPAYAIGVARCAGPAGPCADTSPFPFLASNQQGEGPGEASVFSDPAGIWMLYSPRHSSVPLPDIPPRPVVITRLGFTPAGPYLAAGGPPPSLLVLGPSPVWPPT